LTRFHLHKAGYILDGIGDGEPERESLCDRYTVSFEERSGDDGASEAELASFRAMDQRRPMKNYTAVVERDAETGLLVGYVPGFPGAHSQGETMEELQANLREVIEMILEDGSPRIEAEFVGTQNIAIG
jgi:predicted RNase H-like HicB family nuclease